MGARRLARPVASSTRARSRRSPPPSVRVRQSPAPSPSFPDVFDLAVERALDEREAPKTRVEAFRCVASLVAGSAAAESTVDVRDDGLYRGVARLASLDAVSFVTHARRHRRPARSRACSRGKPIQTTIARRCFVAAPPRRYSPPPASTRWLGEAVDFNPNHEADGTMWHGAFGVLRAPSRDDDVVADDAHAAANVASLLGVVTAAGCKTMDARQRSPADSRCRRRLRRRLDVRRRRLARRVDVRRGSGDGAPSQLAR